MAHEKRKCKSGNHSQHIHALPLPVLIGTRIIPATASDSWFSLTRRLACELPPPLPLPRPHKAAHAEVAEQRQHHGRAHQAAMGPGVRRTTPPHPPPPLPPP